LRGVVRSFQGSWGFVNSDKFEGDLFVHNDSLLVQHESQQLNAGAVVEFDVEHDHHQKGAKHRLVARNIAVLGQSEAPFQQQVTYVMMQLPVYIACAPSTDHLTSSTSMQQATSSPACGQNVAPPQQVSEDERDQTPGGAVASGQIQGLLHITMFDWQVDEPGQLQVIKGTLVNVSHSAVNGWLYASTLQPDGDTGEACSEGWIPQSFAKRVHLGRVLVDWSAETDGTLGVSKGELIAVAASEKTQRGWVYGEFVGPRPPGRQVDGWLPKKVLDDSLQS